MKKRWIKIAWVILPALVVILLVMTMKEDQSTYCSGVSVELDNKDEGCFLTGEDILRHIYAHNDTLSGRNIHHIDVTAIERQLMKIPYVANADVFFTLHGVLKVRVKQRKAVARLFDIRQSSVYLAKDGTFMPVTGEYQKRLLVGSGNIEDSLLKLTGKNIRDLKGHMLLKELYKVASFIADDTLYTALIAQIYVDKDKKLELIPSIDDHIIILGNADSLDYKFRKLMAFYRKGMIRTGWDPYYAINLQYSNQVICSNK